MTPINLIPPQDLIRKHLLAEYRELPRVFGLVWDQVKKGNTPDKIKIPQKYTLGTGHVKFFYNKLDFLRERFTMLVEEMKSRGYKPSYTRIAPYFTDEIPSEWWGDYQPTIDAIYLSKQRIEHRRMEIESKNHKSILSSQ